MMPTCARRLEMSSNKRIITIIAVRSLMMFLFFLKKWIYDYYYDLSQLIYWYLLFCSYFVQTVKFLRAFWIVQNYLAPLCFNDTGDFARDAQRPTHQEPGQSFPGSVSCGSHQGHAPFLDPVCTQQSPRSLRGEIKPECRSECLLGTGGRPGVDEGQVLTDEEEPSWTKQTSKRVYYRRLLTEEGWAAAFRGVCSSSWRGFVTNTSTSFVSDPLQQPKRQRPFTAASRATFLEASMNSSIKYIRFSSKTTLISAHANSLLLEMRFPSLHAVKSPSHLTWQVVTCQPASSEKHSLCSLEIHFCVEMKLAKTQKRSVWLAWFKQ